jgi:hypothetical protein
MKEIKITISLFFVLSFYSCVSTYTKLENDYYQVINLVLTKGVERQDSLFLPLPYAKLEFNKRKKEKEIHTIFKSINLTEYTHTDAIDFLKRQTNIDIEEEMPYYKKQIKQYQVIDTTQISIKKIRYLPRPRNLKDTIKYMDFKYTKYSFVLSRPIFTKNGKYAFIDYYGKSGGVYILIFKKINNNEWKEYAKYLVLKT